MSNAWRLRSPTSGWKWSRVPARERTPGGAGRLPRLVQRSLEARPNTIEDELERDDPDKERVALHLEDNLRLEEGHPRLSAWIDRVNERPRA